MMTCPISVVSLNVMIFKTISVFFACRKSTRRLPPSQHSNVSIWRAPFCSGEPGIGERQRVVWMASKFFCSNLRNAEKSMKMCRIDLIYRLC